MARFSTVDEYVASFPEERRSILEEVRRTMRRAAPGTEETISYDIPTFTLNGRYVIYFAGWKRHIAIYPIPRGDEALDRDIAPYVAAKGTLHFPYDKPVPYDLIERLTAAALRSVIDFLLAHPKP